MESYVLAAHTTNFPPFYRAAATAPPADVGAASPAACTAGLTFFPSLYRMRGGGARFRRPSRERTRTTGMIILPQYGKLTRQGGKHTMGVNSARNTVSYFDVQFWNCVLCKSHVHECLGYTESNDEPE